MLTIYYLFGSNELIQLYKEDRKEFFNQVRSGEHFEQFMFTIGKTHPSELLKVSRRWENYVAIPQNTSFQLCSEN